MRCCFCGWIVRAGGCRCRRSLSGETLVRIPAGTRVLARAGRGPSMTAWEEGEVRGHTGPIHEVAAGGETYWCEVDDLLPGSPEREARLVDGTRVWARWLDGRWYPGTIDGVEGGLRHVSWDDGDAMWLPAGHAVLLVAESGPPAEGSRVLAPRWDGDLEAARVVEEDGRRFRVVFSDQEDAWVSLDDLQACPENPFLDEEIAP